MTPVIKSHGYKTGGDQYKNAHENAQQNVDKGGEKAGISTTFQKFDKSAQLNDRYDKHNDCHENGKIAVGLRCPINDELSVTFLPNSSRE